MGSASQTTEPRQHLVQFYDADRSAWAKTVGCYLADGLRKGEAGLIIATPAHRKTITQQLLHIECDPSSPKYSGHLAFLDAAHTLSKFMIAGEPDWERFRSTIEGAFGRFVSQPVNSRLRAYGEMVGVLWSAGESSAALQLEEFWNRLQGSLNFKLFCGYPINIFSADFNHSNVGAVLCAHTHVVPTGDNGDLEEAMTWALEDAGHCEVKLNSLIQSSRYPNTQVPLAEAAILELRGSIPQQAPDILSAARRHYHSERRFRALIESSSDAMWLMDSSNNITWAGASTVRVLGYQSHELVGRNALEFIHPADIEIVKDDLGRLQPRDPIQLRARALDSDMQCRWIEATFTNLLDDPDVRAIVANFRDISEQVAAEEKQRKHTEELARYNAALESFAYTATHDLREPLRTVSAFTELLVQRCGDDEENEKYSRFILDSVAHMSQMLDDLLALTSLRSPEAFDPVDLRRAVNQALNYLGKLIQDSGATISISPLPCVLGNESQLTELMQNLLGNAIKYRGARPLLIEVTAESQGTHWLIKVKDNGIGIAPAYRQQIFGLFKRLHDRSVPGTGIGLAICKKIVEDLGGRIWVESAEGEGSTFCFTAPSAPIN